MVYCIIVDGTKVKLHKSNQLLEINGKWYTVYGYIVNSGLFSSDAKGILFKSNDGFLIGSNYVDNIYEEKRNLFSQNEYTKINGDPIILK